MRRPYRILVLCTGNSARSQIAEALLQARGGERIAAASAGSAPAPRVNPLAVETLAAHGIDWSGRTPRSLDDVASERFDLVITVCDHARDACPVLPGNVSVHWGLPDPTEAQPERARGAFAETYDALDRRIARLLEAPLEEMDADAVRKLSVEIHREADA